MRGTIACVLAACVVATIGCRAAGTGGPTLPAPAPATTARRVVLLSLDGVAAERHRALLACGFYRDPDGVSSFERSGYVVERAIPVDPTLTAASHTSIATGAFPAATGIVSNFFHLPSTSITAGVSGFNAPWAAESLWQSFHRQGKRVGVLTFPGCDATSDTRRADFGMTYVNAALARAESLTLPGAAFVSTTVPLPEGMTSFSPLRSATLMVGLDGEGVPSSATFTLTALDTTDDGRENFDTLVARGIGGAGHDTAAAIHAGGWFPLAVSAPHPDGGVRTLGAWCLLQALPADLDGVRIYRGAFHSGEAYPRAYRELIEREVGFWPGPPDDRALLSDHGAPPALRLEDVLAQVRRFSEYFTACARVTVRSEPFDLLMAYQPIVDEVEHALLLTDPRQADFSPARAATCAAAIDETYGVADVAVGELARSLDLSRDALVVVSDHGMASVWEAVNINEILRRAGLAEGEEHGRRFRAAASSRIVAFASGGCAHLYVNLQGRETSGVVPPAEREDVVRAAARALAVVEVDGETVVDAMFRREELGPLGLDSLNSGDLVVFFKPGFQATGAIGGAMTQPVAIAGQHGFRNTVPAMAAVWLARGAGVPRAHVPQASLTRVAAFVSALAGIDPPANAARP